ncbi:glycosyltransferase [Sanguibacter suarezii]|uniref:glycosyltransferase n=1 Tax=Sanguibacter suarezii TaxID=60921 RepID=UPI0009FFF9EA|nr:glycosyltransferase [Sanguibacter suarezii]
MRIAMISEHASPLATLGSVDAGGQNVHVASLAQHLGAQGHAVTVYTRRDDPDLPVVVPLAPGVDVVHVDAGPPVHIPKDELLVHMDAFGDELAARWARSAPPDVVHAHFWMSGLAGLRATRTVPAPLVQTFHALGSVKHRHQGDRDTSPAGRVDLERLLCAEVDLIVATCSDEVAELTALGADPDRIEVVPCGVDLDKFRLPVPGQSERVRPDDGRFVALSVGRLVERKGIETIVRALVDTPDVELVVAGGPPAADLDVDVEAARLRALAQELGVADRVRLVGSLTQDEVRAAMHAADVVVCDPWYEPFGIVPIEAAACGRPVVGSAVGGLLDSVLHERTGLLVPPQDPVALARALLRLHSDPGLGEALGAAGRRRAERLYGWSTVAERTAHAYRTAVAATAAPTAQDLDVGSAVAARTTAGTVTVPWPVEER